MSSRALSVAALGLVLAGCGYTLSGRAVNLPKDVQSVYLAPIINLTSRVQLDQLLTQSLADALVTRKRFELVASRTGADAELTGRIRTFSVQPLAFDPEGRATEYQILIEVDLELLRVESSEPLWRGERYQFRDTYAVEFGAATGFQDRETPAIVQAARRFAETAVTDMLEGF